MKVVYCCFGGSHSSPVAAAIHLGRLPADRVPFVQDLMALDLYDNTSNADMGTPVLVGVDEAGHEVYVLGRGKGAGIVERALVSGWRLAGRDDVPFLFADTLRCVNLWMRIGGFLSRGLHLVALGRPLVLYGTRLAFYRLVDFVQSVKAASLTSPAHEQPTKV